MYKKITKNDPEGKLYRIYLQLWDTAGQERYLTVFLIFCDAIIMDLFYRIAYGNRYTGIVDALLLDVFS